LKKTFFNRLDQLFDLTHPPSPAGADAAGHDGEAEDPIKDRALRLAKHRYRTLGAVLAVMANQSNHYRQLACDQLSAASRLFSADLGPQSTSRQWEERIQAILSTLPFTYPQDLKDPQSFLAVSQNEIEGVVTVPTSGSQGPAKRIFSTANDLENIVQFFQYGMLHLVSPDQGDQVALLMSGLRPGSVGHLLSQALERWSIPCHVLGYLESGQNGSEFLKGHQASCLVGLPSQIFYLSRTQKKPRGLKKVLLSGETAPPALVSAIGQAWGVEVFLHYGLTEFGLGGAVECPYHTGPHLREADLIAEVVAPDGTPLPAGSEGELVITSLSRQAMPLLRYRTGDLGAVLNTPCPCGSVFNRLAVKGRLEQAAILNDGQKVTLGELTQTLCEQPFVTGFTAGFKSGKKTTIIVKIGSLDSSKQSRQKVLAALANLFGESMDIRLEISAPQEVVGGLKGLKPAFSALDDYFTRPEA
jgi:phenylacetate-coenzyme A ligase PaaK-like adenylate-forming protein